MTRYYKRIDKDGNTTTVESYSHNVHINYAVEIDKAEYDTYVASLPAPEPPAPARDLAAELDALKSSLVDKGVIDAQVIK